jgi:hypothetical protein
MAKKNKKSKMTIGQAGKNVTLSELMKISRSTGQDPLTVMSKALDKGVGLGRKVVNAYNTPGGLGSYVYQGTPDNLKPLKGLTLGKRQVYQGASSYSTPATRTSQAGYSPGSTTYNPIVGLRKTKNKGKGGGGNDNTGGDQTTVDPIINTEEPQQFDSGSFGDSGYDSGMGLTDLATEAITEGLMQGGLLGGGAGGEGALGFKRKKSSWSDKNKTTKGTKNLNRGMFISNVNFA